MFSRLKISSVLSDENASVILGRWVSSDRPRPGIREINSLFDWYFSNGLEKQSKANHIYRGITLSGKYSFKKVFSDGFIELESRDFDSWSIKPETAFDFAYSKYWGIVISRKLEQGVIDLNVATQYLLDNGQKISGSYDYECEVISVPACVKCSIDKDVECFVVSRNSYSYLVNDIEESDGWSWNEDQNYSDIHRGVICTFKNKVMTPYFNWKDSIKGFKRKPDPDSDCVKIKLPKRINA